MQNLSLLNDQQPTPRKITRALENGTDYQPDWRHLQVQQYLKDVYHEDAEPRRLARLNEILQEEPDPFVRNLLLFSVGRLDGNHEAIEWALKCSRDNFKTRSASMIKAMVVANGPAERIAHEMGTTEDKIETFENLFFDVRRYLEHTGWLAGICLLAVDPHAANMVESRWLSTAFRRRWAGVEEVLLGRRVGKKGERTLQNALSILLGRVDDYCSNLEASGTPPSESDVKALSMLARIPSVGLPYLWDQHEEPPKIGGAFAHLSSAGRERVYCFLSELIDGAAAKALTFESQGSKIEPQEGLSDQQRNSSEPCT